MLHCTTLVHCTANVLALYCSGAEEFLYEYVYMYSTLIVHVRVLVYVCLPFEVYISEHCDIVAAGKM